MKPAANSTDARWPATGCSALAASAALAICAPCPSPRVAAVATMIANMTTWEKVIPENTSRRASWSLRRRARCGRSSRDTALSPPRSSLRSSSTRCPDCQKKRYGEIVVPRIATTIDQ